MVRLATWFLRYRYLLLSLVLVVILYQRIDSSLWTGDFWEHSSVIRELATHPSEPLHPQLALDAPHPFYSPYHLSLALLARQSGKSPVEILAMAGVFNLLLFLTGLYLFIPVISKKDRNAVAFYSLLFIILLVGSYIWNFSGFYHLRALAKILPFPSMIAMGMSLLTLAINQRRIETRGDMWLLPILVLALFVLLTHQFTFIFLASGLIAMTLRPAATPWKELLKIGALLLVCFLVATLWPYYSILELSLNSSAVYHASNQRMYTSIFLRTWPALIGILFLFLMAREDRRNPLPWWFCILLGVYIYGWITSAYSYGRVISYLVVILQMAIALYVARFEGWLSHTKGNIPIIKTAFALGVTIFLVLISYRPLISPALVSASDNEENRLDKYHFLTEYTGQYDVILTPISSSLIVPTFGGKVVAFDRPLPFVLDEQQRHQDVERFFDPVTISGERLEILRKYQVDYILVEKQPELNWEAYRAAAAAHGELIYRGKRFLLYKVST